ncbi:hypothetical protein CC86DRAFT_370354 [Ophiobolus disseminans]|uniref:Uncharacterized protein n=1 Tax=Ophiobolus disseminans TaxID=1469910 RepID=A0A6A7A098_9PLEO|nr:hypothetical protein CC86DRAFT_370354 [Ophiobolus disseminans]
MATSGFTGLLAELLGQIIRDLISGAGVCEAWYLRQVCRKFFVRRGGRERKGLLQTDKLCDIVQYEIIDRLPFDQFTLEEMTESETIIARGILRISLRSLIRSPLRTAHDPRWPIHLVRGLAEKLVRLEKPMDRESRKEEHVQSMTTYLATAYKRWTLDFIMQPDHFQSHKIKPHRRIVATALIGNLDVVKRFLGRDTTWYSECLPHKPFKGFGHETPFWDPLIAAISGGHNNVLGYILAIFASWFRSRRTTWYARALRARLHLAIETAIQADRSETLKMLYKFHEEYSVCLGMESHCLLQPIRYRYNGEASCLNKYVYLAVQHGSINSLRTLMHIQGFKRFGPLVFVKATASLRMAASTKQLGTLVAILRIFSSTGEPTFDFPKAWQAAVRCGDVLMLRFLARRGAPAKAYSDRIRLDPHENEVNGLWDHRRMENRILAQYVVFRMGGSVYPRDESGFSDRTFDKVRDLVERRPSWREKATALMSADHSVIPPGARLYGQALIGVGF